eukprot:TRINITY_DN31766_c0_g1_i3.p1 TRINITY_DN31766_c0_g1~~TRINITY_DN31766_c0_g1_i3.p1  ORF type:complete len:184 (+),score=36.00 TRINITY_DN31766_c0_g1_i3:105-656(+)
MALRLSPPAPVPVAVLPSPGSGELGRKARLSYERAVGGDVAVRLPGELPIFIAAHSGGTARSRHAAAAARGRQALAWNEPNDLPPGEPMVLNREPLRREASALLERWQQQERQAGGAAELLGGDGRAVGRKRTGAAAAAVVALREPAAPREPQADLGPLARGRGGRRSTKRRRRPLPEPREDA